MKRSKRQAACLAALSLLLLTGCWDRREIDQIGMIAGIGLDQGSDSSGNRIKLTQQFVNTTLGMKEGVIKAYYNLTDEGSSLMEIIRRTSSKTDRSPYYTHLKVIILSDKITSSYQLLDLMNLFQRDHEMRRTVRIYFSRGPAQMFLEKEPENKGIPAYNIYTRSYNHYKTSEMAREMTLGEMSIRLSDNESFLAQAVDSSDGTMLQGAAVVSGTKKRLIGWLDKDEVTGINWILGTKKGSEGGIVKLEDKKTKKELVYEIQESKTKIKPSVEGEQISFLVSIETEGKISEDWGTNDAFEKDFIKEVNEKVAEEMKRVVEHSLSKVKDEYRVDVADFGEQLRIHNYKTWKKVKNDWDEAFSRSNVEVEVNAEIREFGSKGRKRPKTKES